MRPEEQMRGDSRRIVDTGTGRQLPVIRNVSELGREEADDVLDSRLDGCRAEEEILGQRLFVDVQHEPEVSIIG